MHTIWPSYLHSYIYATKNGAANFWTLCIHYKKLQHNFPKIRGGGTKTVCNFFPKIRPYQDTCEDQLSQFFWCFNTVTSIIVRWKISSSSLLTNILYSPLPPSPNSQYCSLYTFFHKTRQQHTTRMIVNKNKDDHKNKHGWSKIQTRMITNTNKEYHKYKQGWSQI